MGDGRWLISNRNLFITALEVGKSKVKTLADLVSGESPLLGSRRFHHHHLITTQRVHFLITSLWGLGFQGVNFGGKQAFSSLRQCLVTTLVREEVKKAEPGSWRTLTMMLLQGRKVSVHSTVNSGA